MAEETAAPEGGFVFEVEEATRARRPVIVLVGRLLSGRVELGHRILLRLASGGEEEAQVIGIEPGFDRRRDPEARLSAAPEDPPRTIGLALHRRDGSARVWRADDLLPGTIHGGPVHGGPVSKKAGET